MASYMSKVPMLVCGIILVALAIVATARYNAGGYSATGKASAGSSHQSGAQDKIKKIEELWHQALANKVQRSAQSQQDQQYYGAAPSGTSARRKSERQSRNVSKTNNKSRSAAQY